MIQVVHNRKSTQFFHLHSLLLYILIDEAKKDLEKGKLTYCHYSGNIIHNYLRSEKELIEILKENKIDF